MESWSQKNKIIKS